MFLELDVEKVIQEAKKRGVENKIIPFIKKMEDFHYYTSKANREFLCYGDECYEDAYYDDKYVCHDDGRKILKYKTRFLYPFRSAFYDTIRCFFYVGTGGLDMRDISDVEEFEWNAQYGKDKVNCCATSDLFLGAFVVCYVICCPLIFVYSVLTSPFATLIHDFNKFQYYKDETAAAQDLDKEFFGDEENGKLGLGHLLGIESKRGRPNRN